MRTVLEVLAGAFTVLCVVPYIRDVVLGRTQPQRTSWFGFALLSIVAAAAEISDGAHAGAALACGSAIAFTAVFAMSVRRGVGGRSLRDVISFCSLCGGLALWAATSKPIVAVAAILVADVGGIALTTAKAFRTPDSETLSTWVIDAFAGLLGCLAVLGLGFHDWLYPVYHLTANCVVAGAIVLGRRTGHRFATQPAEFESVPTRTAVPDLVD
jgi:hypothetical protein